MVIKKIDIYASLAKIGLKKGDSVFVTSSLGSLGFPQTDNKNHILELSKWLLKSLKSILGSKGNIFVPTYSYSFTKKRRVFSIKNTKSSIGYFPNYFLKCNDVYRSIDPMISICAMGPLAKNITKNISSNSYGKNCIFEKLLNVKNLKCLNFGVDINWIPFIHYLDWKNNVPFRYSKKIKGIIINNKKREKVTWDYYMRELRNETISDGYKLGKLALKHRLFNKTKLGAGNISCINYKKFYQFCKKKSKKNVWITVKGPKYN